MATAELSRRFREGGPLPTAVRDGRTAAAPVLRGSTRRRRVRGSARESQAAIVAEFRLRLTAALGQAHAGLLLSHACESHCPSWGVCRCAWKAAATVRCCWLLLPPQSSGRPRARTDANGRTPVRPFLAPALRALSLQARLSAGRRCRCYGLTAVTSPPPYEGGSSRLARTTSVNLFGIPS